MGVTHVPGIGERAESYDAARREDLVHEASASHVSMNLLQLEHGRA